MLALSLIALFLGVLSILIAVGVPMLQRPKVKIEPARWSPTRPVGRTYAAAKVVNVKPPRAFRWLIRREIETDIHVRTEFKRYRDEAILLGPMTPLADLTAPGIHSTQFLIATLGRDGRRYALSAGSRSQYDAARELLETDYTVRVVVNTVDQSVERDFRLRCANADFREFVLDPI